MRYLQSYQNGKTVELKGNYKIRFYPHALMYYITTQRRQ